MRMRGSDIDLGIGCGGRRRPIAELPTPTDTRLVLVNYVPRACDGSDADIRLAHACVEEAFVDHWARPRRTFAEWSRVMVYDRFDPALWILAEDDGRVVGATLCRIRAATGEIEQFGVLRASQERLEPIAYSNSLPTEFHLGGRS